MTTALLYLDFDYSEDDAGQGCFDAMADVPASRTAPVEAEIARVLAWAHAQRGWRQAPLDDGGDWDYAVQAAPAGVAPRGLEYDPLRASLAGGQAFARSDERVVYTFTFTARQAVCTALRETFGLD